jgi:hypothetical protein
MKPGYVKTASTQATQGGIPKKALAVARERFNTLTTALGKATQIRLSPPGQEENHAPPLVKQTIEQTVLKNTQDLVQPLWQYSPPRPELLHFLGKGLISTQIGESVGVSETTSQGSCELKREILHSRRYP